MNRVRVDVPDVRGSTLVGDVTATGTVSRFLDGSPFRAAYSRPIEGLPAHIRSIPVLAHVCPVAWAAGADVVVDTADAAFLEALREVRATFLDMYPSFMTGGSIVCPDPVREERDGDGAGLLFTGGVDSTATYVRHREEDPTLVSVRGWVIGADEDERWERTREHVADFAGEHGHDCAFVESNMLSFLTTPLLQAHFQRYLDGPWYSAVGHGLGLLGLCAPLAYSEGWGDLYIAASHTPDWPKPWGSHPDVDDEVAWSGTDCHHDGFALSRQDKVDRIADYVESESADVPLRTCIYADGASNCSDCEKCYRTMLGLLLAGLDPNDHGYEFDAEAFDRIRDHFEAGDAFLSATTTHHWNVLQAAARERTVEGYDGAEEFLEWLARQDFDAFVRDSERPLRHRVLQTLARNTPTPVYSLLYPMYRRVGTAPR